MRIGEIVGILLIVAALFLGIGAIWHGPSESERDILYVDDALMSGTIYSTDMVLFRILADGTPARTSFHGADINHPISPGEYRVLNKHGDQMSTVVVREDGSLIYWLTKYEPTPPPRRGSYFISKKITSHIQALDLSFLGVKHFLNPNF